MPLLLPRRQGATPPPSGAPRAPDWFDGEAGQALLRSEAEAVRRVLAGCPALPWAWLGIPAAVAPAGSRGLLLRPDGQQWRGAVRCGLPLPIASESLGAVLLQHVLDGDDDPGGLLEECARVLAPGGTLWLAALNPWAPYRMRWAGTGLQARTPGGWQSRLRRAGLPAGAVQLQWLGPTWHARPGAAGIGALDLLRAGLAMTVTKRMQAGVLSGGRRVLRWRPAAVPVAGHASGQAGGAAARR
ncbi:class I SAM-dependent methyltransferase [Lysobacter sp. GX 14042]|uniref:methyltransferase domain-containing protein n=1 Tax=Lysobacter sp. GX 14042 TaxID=2907155 RepID=UPI001F2B9FCB|nr:methyltransferase domain-containing protein [Lysobacter sp. GX 14042]MCE7032479.1 class I SAM-dependent methyltransferase [Lysobacter sp. GX 14042]